MSQPDQQAQSAPSQLSATAGGGVNPGTAAATTGSGGVPPGVATSATTTPAPAPAATTTATSGGGGGVSGNVAAPAGTTNATAAGASGGEQQQQHAGSGSRAGNEYEAGVQDVQFLLEALSMQAERPVLRLSQLSSSFFVLAFRQLFGDVPPGVNVSPATAEDRVSNARAVIESLESKLNQSLAHISPEGVARHDEKHISMLLRVFVDIVSPPGGSRLDDTNEEGSHTSQPSAPQVMVRDWLTGLYGGTHHHHHHGDQQQQQQQQQYQSGGGATGGYDYRLPHHAAAGAGSSPETDEDQKHVQHRIRRIANMLSQRDVPRYETSVCDRLVDSDGRLIRQFTGDGPMSTLGIASQHRPSSAGTMARRPLPAMANARRDAKIERLRSEKFLQEAQDAAVREVVRQASKEEVRMVQDLKGQLKEQRETFLCLDKIAKEKDERLRQIYSDNVRSAIGAAKGKGMRLNLHRNAADLVRRERGLVEKEKEECEREIRLQFEMLRAKREAYLSHLSSWRVSVLKQDQNKPVPAAGGGGAEHQQQPVAAAAS